MEQSTHRFNEALVQQVREGKAKIINDDSRIDELIAYIFNVDQSKVLRVCSFYCAHETRGWCGYNEECGRSGIKASDFFLQPPTEKEGKERTYRVTREQLKKLYDATDHVRKLIIQTLALQEDHAWETEITVQENIIEFFINDCHVPVEAIKEVFPDFNPTPHIPKGEFAWVRYSEGCEWRCHMSAGNGKFYTNQWETEETVGWKFVRKYEDRPF